MTSETHGPSLTPTMDAEGFRTVAGHLTSGVAVITAETGGVRFGMTASSVTSLSLDPPLMLVCLNSAMPTARAVAHSGAYAVNVLDRQSAHLAHRFAGAHEDKFAGLATSPGATAAPTLDDALAHIQCEVSEEIAGGTHTIFIGRVVAATARDGEPLAYFRGGFGRFELERDERVYLELRTHLVQRRWSADSALDVDQVAFELELSRSSCYYAMTRLSAEGMLRREQGRGYVVVPFDVADSNEAFDARSAIEIGALHLVGLPLASAVQHDLEALFEGMARFLVDDRFVDFDGYLDANDAFHRALVALAGSPALSAAFEQIGLRSVMASSFGATPGTSQRFVEIQRAILQTLCAGDRAGAQSGVLAYGELAKQRAREILDRTGGVL